MVRIFVACNASRSISLDDVVRHTGMSKSAFCAFFRRATGKTFIAYLNGYRIGQACRMLSQEDMPVSEICYRADFSDIPYFNRVFKKAMGCTPSAYRSRVHPGQDTGNV